MTLAATHPGRHLRTDTIIAGGLIILQILFFFDSSALLSFLNEEIKNFITLVVLASIGVLCSLKLQGRAVKTWNRKLTPLLLFVLAYAVSLLYQTDTGLPEYYSGKLNKLLLITVPTVLAINVVQWTPELLKRTVCLLCAALFIVTLDGSYQLLRSGGFVSRDESFGIDPISLGRSAGFCVLYAFLILNAWRGAAWTRLLFPALLLLAGLGVMFASGSRGPLIALSVALLGLFVWERSLARRFRIVILALLALVLGSLTASYLTQNGVASSARVLAFLQGDVNVDRSAQTRSLVYEDALGWITQHPLGSGQAASDVYIPNSLRYPHNLPLEIQLEGGIVSTLLFIAAVVLAYRNAARSTGNPARVLILSAMTYFLVNSLFSGDMSSNRLLFLLLALAAVMPRVPTPGGFSREVHP